MAKFINILVKHIPKGIRYKLDCLMRDYYASKECMVIPYIDGLIVECDGIKYEFGYEIRHVQSVKREYRFADILKTDVIIDIGANIGAFSLPVACIAKKVYAVEPLYADILKRNIRLNHLNNVYVFEVGITDKMKNQVIQFSDRKKRVCCVPLSKILDQTEGCDFLKLDCEGGELSITVEDLKRVRRRVEGELHLFNGENPHTFFKMFKDAGFYVEVVDTLSSLTKLFHAYRKDII